MRHRPSATAVLALAGLLVAGAVAMAGTIAGSPAAGGGSARVDQPRPVDLSRPATSPSSFPVLPSTPVGSAPVLGSTTTIEIGDFTHPADGIWMTPHGVTLTLAAYLNDFGLATSPRTYGGIVASGDFITVYLTTLNGGTERAFRSVTQAGTLRFAATPHTLEFLLALQQIVLRCWKEVTAQGVHLVGAGPSIQTGRLTLSVESPTPQSDSELDAMFGASNITITQGYPAVATTSSP